MTVAVSALDWRVCTIVREPDVEGREAGSAGGEGSHW